MKWILCENNKPDSKYWQGSVCHEEVLVDDNATKGVCWKCVAVMVPIETSKPKTGYPRGWKFMNEFVDKDGNVYHKGVIKPELFGTLQPTPIKESKKREKKKDTFEELVNEELAKRLTKNKTKKKSSDATKLNSENVVADKWFSDTRNEKITVVEKNPKTKKSTETKKQTKKSSVSKKSVKKVVNVVKKKKKKSKTNTR